jgi:hypothetical protein
VGCLFFPSIPAAHRVVVNVARVASNSTAVSCTWAKEKGFLLWQRENFVAFKHSEDLTFNSALIMVNSKDGQKQHKQA